MSAAIKTCMLLIVAIIITCYGSDKGYTSHHVSPSKARSRSPRILDTPRMDHPQILSTAQTMMESSVSTRRRPLPISKDFIRVESRRHNPKPVFRQQLNKGGIQGSISSITMLNAIPNTNTRSIHRRSSDQNPNWNRYQDPTQNMNLNSHSNLHSHRKIETRNKSPTRSAKVRIPDKSSALRSVKGNNNSNGTYYGSSKMDNRKPGRTASPPPPLPQRIEESLANRIAFQKRYLPNPTH